VSAACVKAVGGLAAGRAAPDEPALTKNKWHTSFLCGQLVGSPRASHANMYSSQDQHHEAGFSTKPHGCVVTPFEMHKVDWPHQSLPWPASTPQPLTAGQANQLQLPERSLLLLAHCQELSAAASLPHPLPPVPCAEAGPGVSAGGCWPGRAPQPTTGLTHLHGGWTAALGPSAAHSACKYTREAAPQSQLSFAFACPSLR
jgi:hypothetical protein